MGVQRFPLSYDMIGLTVDIWFAKRTKKRE